MKYLMALSYHAGTLINKVNFFTFYYFLDDFNIKEIAEDIEEDVSDGEDYAD